MNIKQQLLEAHSRNNGMLIAKEVNKNKKHIDTLIELLTAETVFQQRASQALAYTVEYFKLGLTAVQLTNLIELLKDSSVHDAVHRNILKILDFHKSYPIACEGFIFEFCTESIMNLQKSIAVRAFSVPVAYRIALKYPDLQNELEQILSGLSDMESPGIKTRKSKYLPLLRA